MRYVGKDERTGKFVHFCLFDQTCMQHAKKFGAPVRLHLFFLEKKDGHHPYITFWSSTKMWSDPIPRGWRMESKDGKLVRIINVDFTEIYRNGLIRTQAHEAKGLEPETRVRLDEKAENMSLYAELVEVDGDYAYFKIHPREV